MKSFISLGKFKIKYFIMIAICFAIFYCKIKLIDLFEKDKNKYIEKYKRYILEPFLKYLGQSYFILSEIIRKKYFKYADKHFDFINKKDIFIILAVSIGVIIGHFLDIIMNVRIEKDISKIDDIERPPPPDNENFVIDETYNSVEYISLFITSLFIFKIKYYKHQYISIIIIICLELTRYFARLISTRNMFRSKMGKIEDFLNQIPIALIDSIFLGYSKILMEYKFLTPYMTTYIFGIICFIIILIIYIILSFISVKEDNSYCFVKFNNKCYIDNFFSIFSHFSFIQFISLFLYSIISGLLQFLFNFIIKDYTICHIFLHYQFCEFYSIIFKFEFMNTFRIVLYITTGIIEILITFIFLEIIQLNFCGLDKNVKENIEERALLDNVENQLRTSSSYSHDRVSIDNYYVEEMKECGEEKTINDA